MKLISNILSMIVNYYLTSCVTLLLIMHSVHTHPLPSFCWGWGWGWGLEPSTQFSKRGGLTGPQSLEGVPGKEGGDFFQEGEEGAIFT